MKRRIICPACGVLVLLLCLGMLTGCENREEGPQKEAPKETEQTVPPESSAPIEQEPLTAPDRETVKRELLEAIEELRQPRTMDISAAGLEAPEMDAKNLYYELMAERPEMKYAYDLTVTVREGELTCRFSYMPYKTGAFPEGGAGEEIPSLSALLTAAESHLGESEAPIRITDSTLEPDRMNQLLRQVGGGYILCTLNADATKLVYSPPPGLTLEECMEALAIADRLAEEVVEQVITDGMTQMEQAQTLYAYLTVNVAYDQRYYSDKANMPYASQTAVGALRDGSAICGGYANALKLLYEKVDIPCYTVSGKYFQENHMWNVARLDGEWLWFDATTDRGSTGEFGFLRFALTELDPMKYHYEEADVTALTAP